MLLRLDVCALVLPQIFGEVCGERLCGRRRGLCRSDVVCFWKLK